MWEGNFGEERIRHWWDEMREFTFSSFPGECCDGDIINEEMRSSMIITGKLRSGGILRFFWPILVIIHKSSCLRLKIYE